MALKNHFHGLAAYLHHLNIAKVFIGKAGLIVEYRCSPLIYDVVRPALLKAEKAGALKYAVLASPFHVFLDLARCHTFFPKGSQLSVLFFRPGH